MREYYNATKKFHMKFKMKGTNNEELSHYGDKKVK